MSRLVRAGILLAMTIAVSGTLPALAVVWYDEGRITIDDVELFRDVDDKQRYYYLPPSPTLALLPDGNPKLLCLKYVDPQGDASGGLLHFLATLRLPPERLEAIEEKLEEKIPGASIAGSLPLMEERSDAGTPAAAFRVVSAVLSDTAEGGFTRSLISSGHAPVTPGSEAAVAAKLDPRGATLLWDSLGSATSDVSVSVTAEYEARVRGYNATVRAEVDMIYEHLSGVMNKQDGYKKRELRQVTDELVQNDLLQIEVFDRSEALGIDASSMESILSLITDKLANLMFDAEVGLAKIPEKEQAVTKGQIRGRQSRGAFVKWFAGTGNPKYVTDDQYVLKSRKDIRRTTFSLNLARDTTVRVPVHLTGNMGGLYESFRGNPEIFRVVNIGDPAFQVREVRFVLDGEWAASFDGLVNWVSVQLRKEYGQERPPVDAQAQLSAADVGEGTLERTVRYPRLGATDSEWLAYGYRVNWSLSRHGSISEPTDESWTTSTDPVVTLRPPLLKTDAEIEIDRATMTERGVRAGVVEVRSKILGSAETRRAAVLRTTDAESVLGLTAIHDPGTVPEARLTWISSRDGTRREGEWIGLDAGYLWVEVPDMAAGGGRP